MTQHVADIHRRPQGPRFNHANGGVASMLRDDVGELGLGAPCLYAGRNKALRLFFACMWLPDHEVADLSVLGVTHKNIRRVHFDRSAQQKAWAGDFFGEALEHG